MMTLEEVWENLRQDPEVKATMEEADKSYKLFKKIENLIVSDLEAKLAESEKRLVNCVDFNTWQKTAKENKELKQQLAESESKSFILYSMLYETLEKQGSEDIASQIEQMTGLMLEKQADWFKGNRNYDQLKQQLAEKNSELKKWSTQYARAYVVRQNDLIAEKEQLKQQLADALKDFNDIQEENDKLAQQLQEEKNRNKKLNHEAQKYYEDAYCNGSQNQTAIAELEKVKQEFNGAFSISIQQEIFDKYIDQQIKSLKGEVDGSTN